MKHVSMMPPTGPPYYRQRLEQRKEKWVLDEFLRKENAMREIAEAEYRRVSSAMKAIDEAARRITR